MIVPNILGGLYLGPSFAVTQGLVGLRMRGLASSILSFVLNLIGLGPGPQVAGVISDALGATTSLGTDALRWSLTICLVFTVVSAMLFFFASRTLRSDLARSRELSASVQPFNPLVNQRASPLESLAVLQPVRLETDLLCRDPAQGPATRKLCICRECCE